LSSFQQIITGNEWWFFLYYPGDSVWAASLDKFLNASSGIGIEKCLVSILWSVDRIRSPFDAPKETTCNIEFFTGAVMFNLIENTRSRIRMRVLKGWLMGMDNVCPHNSGSSGKVYPSFKSQTSAVSGLQPRPDAE
jgi:hypothetical protein